MRTPLTQTTGDLFTAPRGSILAHACNTRGSWGAGIALAFKKRYPRAYRIYSAHCKRHAPDGLVGTTLLIPPGEGEHEWIACLITRRAPLGPHRMSAARVEVELQATLDETRKAFAHLLRQLDDARTHGAVLGEQIAMPRINAGLFRCPWERTLAVLRAVLEARDAAAADDVLIERDGEIGEGTGVDDAKGKGKGKAKGEREDKWTGEVVVYTPHAPDR